METHISVKLCGKHSQFLLKLMKPKTSDCEANQALQSLHTGNLLATRLKSQNDPFVKLRSKGPPTEAHVGMHETTAKFSQDN